jgi:hypothetical protein
MKYYLILSEGAYSDYSPTYYVGDKEITYSEFKKKGEEIGDLLLSKFDNLPTREHNRIKCEKYYDGRIKCTHEELEKYWEESLEKAHRYDLKSMWMKEMEKWIFENGFEELPSDIPEINIYYDVPTSKDTE